MLFGSIARSWHHSYSNFQWKGMCYGLSFTSKSQCGVQLTAKQNFKEKLNWAMKNTPISSFSPGWQMGIPNPDYSEVFSMAQLVLLRRVAAWPSRRDSQRRMESKGQVRWAHFGSGTTLWRLPVWKNTPSHFCNPQHRNHVESAQLSVDPNCSQGTIREWFMRRSLLHKFPYKRTLANKSPSLGGSAWPRMSMHG